MITIDDTHPYYEEIFELSSMIVANMSVLNSAAATKTIRFLGGVVNTMIKTGKTNVKCTVTDHSMSKNISIASATPDEFILLHETDDLFSYLAGVTNEKPKNIIYSIETKEKTKVAKKQDEDPTRTTMEGSDPTRRFELLSAYIIGGAFERFKGHFTSKYGKDPSKWHPELQFFRHLRNGCFHSNTFNIKSFKGHPQIDSTNPPVWNSYVMTTDKDMNGRKVLGDFFHIPQTIPFLDNMKALI